MNFITGWAAAIIGVVILASFAELILPKGDMKKYADLIMGLIVMIVLIRPMMQLENIDILKQEFNFDIQMIDTIEETQNEQVREMFEQRVSKDMERALKEDFYEMYVTVEVDDNMNISCVWVLGAKEKDAQSIIAVLKRQYGSIDKIIIE